MGGRECNITNCRCYTPRRQGPDLGNSIVAFSISAIVAWAHRHRLIVVGLVLGALVGAIAGARRLTFDADVLSLLPRDSAVIQSFRQFLARFGSLDQLYVVFTAPEGHAVSEYDEINLWIERFRSAPEIARVDPGVVTRPATSAGSPTINCSVGPLL